MLSALFDKSNWCLRWAICAFMNPPSLALFPAAPLVVAWALFPVSVLVSLLVSLPASLPVSLPVSVLVASGGRRGVTRVDPLGSFPWGVEAVAFVVVVGTMLFVVAAVASSFIIGRCYGVDPILYCRSSYYKVGHSFIESVVLYSVELGCFVGWDGVNCLTKSVGRWTVSKWRCL